VRDIPGLKFSIILSLLLLAGCLPSLQAIKEALEEPEAREAVVGAQVKPELPPRFILHSVPHNPRRQRGTDCGPDSLRMVLNYYGKNVHEGDITKKIRRRGRHGGVSLSELARIAKEYYGLEAYVMMGGKLEVLKALLLNGWPPIVAYRARGDIGHAVVVVGYNDLRGYILVHDPNFLRVTKIPYRDFLPAWRQFGGWMLVVVPKGITLPDVLNAVDKYVEFKRR